MKTMNYTIDTMQKMVTLSEQLNIAVGQGYLKNFGIDEKKLIVVGSHTGYTPQQIQISNFYRFESNTDPQDSSILYLIETEDGKKGTLVDAYGVYADSKIAEFIRSVEDIRKVENGK